MDFLRFAPSSVPSVDIHKKLDTTVNSLLRKVLCDFHGRVRLSTYERSSDGELKRIYAGASIVISNVKTAKLSHILLLTHHSIEGVQFSAWHFRKEVAQAQDQLADRSSMVYISNLNV